MAGDLVAPAEYTLKLVPVAAETEFAPAEQAQALAAVHLHGELLRAFELLNGSDGAAALRHVVNNAVADLHLTRKTRVRAQSALELDLRASPRMSANIGKRTGSNYRIDKVLRFVNAYMVGRCL